MSYFVPSKYIRQNGVWLFDSFVKNAYFNMDDALNYSVANASKDVYYVLEVMDREDLILHGLIED